MVENKSIKIYQIHFDEKSRRNCYPEWELYDNSNKLTEFFENSVIVDLIANDKHKEADYFGVFSHDVEKDLPFKEDNLRFNPSTLKRVINKNGHDVFSFFKRRKQHNIITQAENYHPGFVKMIEAILEETKFLPYIPKRLDKIVLFNYWIAKSEIYAQYVNELLIPAMNVLKSLPEAYHDANYVKKVDERTKYRFIQAFGKPYYPYHPFVCERLPSLFMAKYNYSFKQIF